jgi:hypothetical protein
MDTQAQPHARADTHLAVLLAFVVVDVNENNNDNNNNNHFFLRVCQHLLKSSGVFGTEC